MRSQKLYFSDIIESITKILEYTKGIDYDKFTKNSMIFDAVVRNFEIIGEAAKSISDKIKSEYPDIPWADMVGMRNILIHGYFGIDYSIVWNTIELLPHFLKDISGIQQFIEDESMEDKDSFTLETSLEDNDKGK